MKRFAVVAMTAVLALGGATLAACSSSSEESGQMVGGDPGTWAPIDITQSTNGTTVDMVVGQAAIFTDLPDSPTVMVESSDPMVVEASQAGVEGDATMSAGLVARGEGTATITAVDTAMPADAGGASNVIIQFEVNVSAE